MSESSRRAAAAVARAVSARSVKSKGETNSRQLRNLRETMEGFQKQLTTLATIVENDGKKLDGLQEKMEQVLDILSKFGPTLTRLAQLDIKSGDPKLKKNDA